ncbi:unnamed protein product [Cladocopium goreaui]|uniref:Uncharacterized protein n=1 Tax=Cladocopium goreaui TaxID=2562237 RepID=A0A9P1FIB3_9DINO|nr:unnamed protein product [Cladocopium goreaui]
MSVDVTNMTFKVCRATEVWQSMSSNTLLFQLEEGKMVKAMDAKAVPLGSKYYVPIMPRGWVSASDLEGFPWPGNTLESGQDLPTPGAPVGYPNPHGQCRLDCHTQTASHRPLAQLTVSRLA